jgi:predicted dehydrogenase
MKKSMKSMARVAGMFILVVSALTLQAQNIPEFPLRIAVAGMTHDHVAFILNDTNNRAIKLVGIFEPNRELVQRVTGSFHFDPGLIYDDLDRMLDQVKPEAVAAFGSTFEHLAVVEACAPRGIHVMVEKPLATNLKDAERMYTLAKKYHIHLLTDYETSWYPSTAKSFQLLTDSNFIGGLRKVVVHDGHQGPEEIGCSKEFLEWLTDPIRNGGGAIMDFGCYGANLMTYLSRGQEPISVTAVTRQFKPEVYPKVDDDATLVLSYPGFIGIIQASWNWPFGRKDMEIYGENGYIIAENNRDMRLKNRETGKEQSRQVTSNDVAVFENPFTYFAGVIRGKIIMTDYDLYSPENNLRVVRILDAARESAGSGKTVSFR